MTRTIGVKQGCTDFARKDTPCGTNRGSVAIPDDPLANNFYSIHKIALHRLSPLLASQNGSGCARFYPESSLVGKSILKWKHKDQPGNQGFRRGPVHCVLRCGSTKCPWRGSGGWAGLGAVDYPEI